MTLLANKFGLHSFTWLPRNYHHCLAAMSSISQACCASPFRYVQIKSSPDETNPKDMLLGLTWGKPRNPITQSLTTGLHVLQLAPKNLPRAATNLESRIGLWSHTSLCWTHGLPIYNPRSPTVNLAHMRLHAQPGFLASPSRAGEHLRSSNAPKNPCWCHLTSSNDVIIPRQQPRKHVHVNPSHVSATS